MKVTFLIITLLHGLIHILGFLKAFGIREIKEMTLPISKTMGILWLLVTILFLIYGFTIIVNSKYSWIIGLVAIIISQFIIIYFWTDAKFGSIPNILILLVVLFSFGTYNFNKIIESETSQILSNVSLKNLKPISETALNGLPKPIQKWIKTTGIIGKDELKVAWIKQKALMKMKPEQKDWYSAEAIQYSTFENPAFIWTVEMEMMPLINIKGRDKFFGGKGEMLIKINSLINVVNEKGEKLDEGTLQRYLGELVWFPSLALSPLIEWEEIDDFSAKATIKYYDIHVSGTFYFNENGDFTKFITLRYMGNEDKKYPWVLTVDGYSQFEGIKIPSKMKATWKLDKGDWTWLDLEILEVKYNDNVSIFANSSSQIMQ